ncbi:MAG: helicase, partial [Cetobacterium sp.]
RDDRETRYSRLLNKVIKSGVKTKILMLSATPVNNKINDLKNQIAFITEGDDSSFQEDGVKSVEVTMKKAQTVFNRWNELPTEEKSVEKLLDMLEMDYFKLLDMLTIARSRKHIEKYYNMTEIGKFPTRLKPINIYADIDTSNKFPELKQVNNSIRRLNLSIYTPMAFLRPDKVAEYERKYDKKVNNNSVFKQSDREKSLIYLMRVNLLKRMESSINSFGLTVTKVLKQIDVAIQKLDNHSLNSLEDIEIKDIEIDDQQFEDMLIGTKKVKVLIQDMDLVKWRESLEEDKRILENLMMESAKVSSRRDSKLQDLKSLIINKNENPINDGNRKIIVFTAFADTAEYLYENIKDWAKENLGLDSALITGSGTNRTTFKGIKTDLNTLLTNFSPISKEREKILSCKL